MAGLKPNAVVIVATVRALKYNGGVPKADLNNENLEALEKGLPNLLKHVDNIKNVYKLPCVVAINAFPTDTKAELDLVEAKCKELGVNVALSEVWAKGCLLYTSGIFYFCFSYKSLMNISLDCIRNLCIFRRKRS